MARFETMPSSLIAQAWRNIASPSDAAMCSEKRSAGPAFLSAFPHRSNLKRGTAALAIRRRVEQEDSPFPRARLPRSQQA